MSGRLFELGPLRYTPAGIPAVEFKLRHQSQQSEAGGARAIEAEVGAIAFDTHARLLAGSRLNSSLKVQGFIAAKSRRSKKLVLHVTHIEFIEGEVDASAA